MGRPDPDGRSHRDPAGWAAPLAAREAAALGWNSAATHTQDSEALIYGAERELLFSPLTPIEASF